MAKRNDGPAIDVEQLRAEQAQEILARLAELEASNEELRQSNDELKQKVSEGDEEVRRQIEFKAREADIEAFLADDQPATSLYVIKDTGPQNIRRAQHTIEVIQDRYDKETEREREGVVLSFRRPDKNIGEELKGRIVLYCDVASNPNVSVTSEEAKNGYFMFRGEKISLPPNIKVNTKDGAWPIQRVFESLFHMPKNIQDELLDGPAFKEAISFEYQSLLTERRNRRLAEAKKGQMPQSAWKRGDALAAPDMSSV